MKHLMLVGLPGAGKSAVGAAVAELLRMPFVDSDVLIVRRMQMPVDRIFAVHGEAEFRRMEREIVAEALAGEPAVIAPGGGWAAQDGSLATARAAGAMLLYLRTPPQLAADRIAHGEPRPLVAGPNPDERMRELLQEREPFYTQADGEIWNDHRPVNQVAEEVVRWVQGRV